MWGAARAWGGGRNELSPQGAWCPEEGSGLSRWAGRLETACQLNNSVGLLFSGVERGLPLRTWGQ